MNEEKKRNNAEQTKVAIPIEVATMSTEYTESDCIDALPEDYRCIMVDTFDPLDRLGAKTLLSFLAGWRRQERELSREIHTLAEYLDVIDGKTVADLREMAKGYKSPELKRARVDIGEPPEHRFVDAKVNTYSGPMPYTEDAVAKELAYGDTTFNLCGWCQYAQQGRDFPTCSPENWCELSRNGYHQSTVREFDAPCQFLEKGDDFIKETAEKLKAEKTTLLSRREDVRKRIKVLLEALKTADQEFPLLASLRPENHFRVGERVVFFAHSWIGRKPCVRSEQRGKFIIGQVVKKDGALLTLHFGEPVLAETQNENVGWDEGCSIEVSTMLESVMSEMEYNYFQTHKEKCFSWLHYSAIQDPYRANLVMLMVKAMLL